jgi:hypothetical protein
MDEIFARRDLIEPALLRALSTRSDRAGFLQLSSHLCAIFATRARTICDTRHDAGCAYFHCSRHPLHGPAGRLAL